MRLREKKANNSDDYGNGNRVACTRNENTKPDNEMCSFLSMSATTNERTSKKKQIKIIIMLVGTVTLAFPLPLSEQPFNSIQFLGSQKHENPKKKKKTHIHYSKRSNINKLLLIMDFHVLLHHLRLNNEVLEDFQVEHAWEIWL